MSVRITYIAHSTFIKLPPFFWSHQFHFKYFILIIGGKSKKPPGLDKELTIKSTHVTGRLTALAPIVDDIIHSEDNIDEDYTDFHHSKGNIYINSPLLSSLIFYGFSHPKQLISLPKGFAEFKSIDLHALSRHDSDSRIVKNKVKLTRKPRLGDSKKLNAIANIRKSIDESYQKPSSSALKLPSLSESGSSEFDENTRNDKSTGKSYNKHRSSPGYEDARAFAEEISMSSSMPVKKSNRYTLMYSFMKSCI